MKDKNNYKTIGIVVLIVLSLCMVVAVSTYAWFKWRTTGEQVGNINLTATAVVTFVGGRHIDGYLDSVFDYTDGLKKDIKITSELSDNTFDLYLKVKAIPEELQGTYFLWVVYKGDEYVAGGDFSEVNPGDTITLFTDKEIPVDEYDTYHGHDQIDDTV